MSGTCVDAAGLREFVPPRVFDAHAHLYRRDQLGSRVARDIERGPMIAGYELYAAAMAELLGTGRLEGGLLFPYPAAEMDMPASNAFLRDELVGHAESRGLMMIHPHDDPAMIERQVLEAGWRGFKVYHLFSGIPDTMSAQNEQFLPSWAWELADRHELIIMLHLVRQRALADPINHEYVFRQCRRYPRAKLVLAHAARGFCSRHTVEAVGRLRGLDNVWFDTSAICEPEPLMAILRVFGPRRLLYGSDYPVSIWRSRPVSVGDGFIWPGEESVEAGWKLGRFTSCGIESLLALQQACASMHLRDGDIEHIFRDGARAMLRLDARPTGQKGQELYARAKGIMPGGTQLLSKRPELFAPGQWPPYFAEARGCEVIDLDGRKFIDMTTTGIGSCLLGYNDPDVTAAVIRRVSLGSMSSLNSPDEVKLAEALLELHPWAEQVRLARCGGEAMAVAVRIARAATGRDRVAFCGYHGWTDWYIAANLSKDDKLRGHLLSGISPKGVPQSLAGTAFPFSFNQIDQLKAIAQANRGELAAVVMEPTRSVDPAPGFLEEVRAICDESGAKLVFDEITAGFRLGRGGAHLRYGIKPDAAVFAKALGNGHPIAAIIGRGSMMHAAQESFISSTYWTEATGPAAALATLGILARVDAPAYVHAIGTQYREGCRLLASKHKLPLTIAGHPALTALGFDDPQSAALMTLVTTQMLSRGFLVSSGFYPTLSHESYHVEACLRHLDETFALLREALDQGNVEARLGGPVKHSGFARLT